MEKLIIVRHGKFGTDGHLLDSGREQTAALAKKILEHVRGDSIALLSSSAPRGCESAAILGETLGVPWTSHELLWAENGRPSDCASVLTLIRRQPRRIGTVVLVTHYDYTYFLPEYIGRRVLGVRWRRTEIKNSEAWVIDCKRKTLALVSWEDENLIGTSCRVRPPRGFTSRS